MLQDIFPHLYHCEYRRRAPEDTDIMILQKDRSLLLSKDTSCPLPTVGRIRHLCPQVLSKAFYLFSIDEKGFFSLANPDPERLFPSSLSDSASTSEGLSWESVMVLRERGNDWSAFGGALGWHLTNWYSLHRFCGRCGSETAHSEKERALICPVCGHTWYPVISPVVIIAIVDGERILLTRYNRNGYRRHALVAGFVEIGETFEDAVRREIMEEVGLKVKNIRYVESQPWPFSSSLIAGFQAEVDGDPTVHLNTDGGEELAEAVWVDRRDLRIEDSSVSLTWDMIRRFRDGSLFSSP